MNRKHWRGPLLMLLLLVGGHVLRDALLVGPDGAWRDPGWLEQFLPPVVDTATAGDKPAAPRITPQHPLALNLAPAESLTALPGVGPVLAARIVSERERGGPFRSAEDLVRVRGIGPRTAARLAPLLDFTVGREDSVVSSSRLHDR